jgi:hypothetical protein
LGEFQTFFPFSPLPLQHHSYIFHHYYLSCFHFGITLPLLIAR